MTIECPQCHYKNPEDAEFCEQCGAQLPVGAVSGAASSTGGSSFASTSTSSTSGSVSSATSTPAAAPAATPAVDENICPTCKAPFAPGDQFCFNCGADLRNVGSNAASAANGNSTTSSPAPAAIPPVQSPIPANDPFADAFAELDNPQSGGTATNVAPPTPAPSTYAPTMISTPSAPPAPRVSDPAPQPSLDPQPTVSAPAPQSDPTPAVSQPRGFSTSPLAAPPAPAPVAATPAPAAVTTFTLNVTGPHGPETVQYAGREMLLGRRDPRTRIFPDLNLDDSATSRRHLALWLDQDDGKVYVQDLESANGTSLNGKDLEPGSPAEVKDGDTIKLGTRYSIQVTFG